MPLIRVEGPKIDDVDRKRKIVKKLTDVAAEMYEMDKEKIIVLIQENEPENVGVGGELILDRIGK